MNQLTGLEATTTTTAMATKTMARVSAAAASIVCRDQQKPNVLAAAATSGR